jgi:bifunctional non-homologous end joining protein LigD
MVPPRVYDPDIGTALTAIAWGAAELYGEQARTPVEREAGKPRSLMAERGAGRYVGSAFINRDMWNASVSASRSAQARRPEGNEATGQWLKRGLIGLVKHLRGEEDLRHASLQGLGDRIRPRSTKS